MDHEATKPSTLKRILLWRPSSVTERPDILLLDGGVSTHLQDKIEPKSFRHRALWSSSLLLDTDGQQVILEGHKDWLEAGANIISTVTYQCHYEHDLLPKQDDATISFTDAQMDAMFRDAIFLARQAQSLSKALSYVAVSLGCYGAALANGAEYTGCYGATTRQDLVQFHRRKVAQALCNEPDAIAFETISSFEECVALCELLQDASLPWKDSACWISLACRNSEELNDGTPLLDASNVFTSVPADRLQGIGLNCCAVLHLPGLITTLVQHLARPDVPTRAILLYPNTGETWDAERESWKAGTGCTAVNDFCDHLLGAVSQIEREWPKGAGRRPVIVLGGCCRTKPEVIAELRRRLDTNS